MVKSDETWLAGTSQADQRPSFLPESVAGGIRFLEADSFRAFFLVWDDI